MGIFDSIGSIVGDVVGNTLLPGIGGEIGSVIGGELGGILGNSLGDVFKQFEKDPVGTLSDPASLPSQFVDSTLKQLGVPAPFRSLAKFALDPEGAIKNILGGLDQCNQKPVAAGGGCCPVDNGLSTNGKDTVDTGRYLISANEGELKVYDKQTKTWVQCQGDPHLSTSDGDHGQFQKNLTLDLPDGTEVKIKTTPQDKNGVAYIDKVAVLKGDEAVVISGFHDGKPGVDVGHVLNNADSVAKQWDDGTVLRAGKNVSDLTYASDGKEIIGGDPNGRWGEWNLDNHGGVGRYDNASYPSGGTTGTGGTGDTGGTVGDVGGSGGGIYDKLFALLAKLQDKLNQKMDAASNIDPSNQAGLQKAMFEVQQIQNQMQELVTQATNMLKTQHDTQMSEVRNLA
jgi:hypothetical protein